MFVPESATSLSLVREGRTYYFCSESCLHEFAEPERERARLWRRLVVAWPLALAVVLLLTLAPSRPEVAVAAGLATVVQVYSGGPFYVGLRDAIRDRAWNMDVLIAVGTSTAYVYSLALLLVPGRLPGTSYFDASALIVALILTGHYLERRTRARAGAAVSRLGELLPVTVGRLRDGAESEVPLPSVLVGDRLRVRPGGRIPTDGLVRDGTSSVDERALTGEPLPVVRRPGEPVLAGSVNGEGTIEVEVTAVGRDTFLSQIGRLVTQSEMARVPLQRTADRIASVFVPLVLGLAVLAAVLWEAVGGASATDAILVFVTVVITACPCAFGIATPAAILVGLGRAADDGVLFRGDDAVQRAARVDLVVTDKTGTLTRGEPTLVEICPAEGATEASVLLAAAAVELGSEHPLARAVEEAARSRGLQPSTATDVRAVPGVGVRGLVAGTDVAILRSPDHGSGTDLPPEIGAAIDRLATAGKTLALVLHAGRVTGLLAFDDLPRPGASEAVRALREDGIRVIMATGDHERAARVVAEAVGIDEVHAGMTPDAKLGLIRELRSASHTVAFVGDGINDAPALAGADLGIAIGSGTEVAREAGQVLLVRSEFGGVALALRLARRTVGKVRGNLAWAIAYNAVLLPIAMGALVPLLGFGVYAVLPIAGAIAMALSSTLVVANSLSLRRVDLPYPAPALGARASLAH